MAVVGSATLNIVPKVVGGLANAINAEVGAANVGGIGKKAGGLFSGGFTDGASFGVWSKVASTAMDAVSNSLGNAASRVDTLNNYPKVMESLGVETDDAAKSIQTMSDGLSNVPTKLDDMAATTEGIYAATKKYGTSLETVTDAGLALNSMLLAGGQSTGVVNAAMEQFRQMVSKGKPELQDWRSLISAAPGQMEQLAEAMLGTGKTADDLYKALGGGQQGQAGIDFMPEISMGEFVEKFAKLKDRFTGDAEEAQGGIQTAFANMQNAVTRGVAGVLDSIGQENIAGVFNDMKGWINDLFGFIKDFSGNAAPVLKDVWDTISDAASSLLPSIGGIASSAADGVLSFVKAAEPIASAILPAIGDILSAISGPASAIAPAVTLFGALNTAMGGISGVVGTVADGFGSIASKAMSSGMPKVAGLFFDAAGGAEALSGAMTGPLGIAIGATVGVIGAYIAKHQEAREESERFYGAVRSVSDVVEDASGKLSTGARAVGDFAGAYSRERPDVEGLEKTITDYVNNVGRIADNSSEQIGLLGQYKTVIDEMAGQGEASAGDMAKLEWALDGIKDATGQAYEASDVLRGAYKDEAGEVHNVAEEIDNLIGKRQEELRMDALKEMYTETYKTQAQAALELTRAEADYSQAHDAWISAYIAGHGDAANAEQAWLDSQSNTTGGVLENLNRTQAAYESVTGELEQLEDMMGQAAQASEDHSSKLLGWIDSHALASAALNDTKINVGDFAKSLEDAGVKTDDLAAIGEDNFMRLVNACKGDVDAIINEIELYNNHPVNVKEGKVIIDDAKLRDANNEIYKFNEQNMLVDKNGKVAVKDTELKDANDKIFVWNGTELVPKSVKVTAKQDELIDLLDNARKANDTKIEDKSAAVHVDDGGLPSLIDQANEFMRLPDNTEKRATYVTDHVTNHIDNYSSGGHAAGGHIEPRHAGGFIAAGPTHTKYGLVGEDGIEATWVNDDGSMDVYPLSNPRYLGYAKPLAESIAANIAPLVGGGDTYIINGLTVPAESELASYMRKVIKGAIREGRA